MAGYIGSKSSVTLVDGYTEAEADAEFVTKTGDTMSGDLSLGDNDKAIFGAGSDLQIYHNGGSGNFIDSVNKDLYIRCNLDAGITGGDIAIQPKAGENSAVFRDNAGAELYYDNSKKLETTSTGVDVTGTVTSDGLTVTQSGSTTAKIGATGTSGDNDGTLIINNGGTGDGMLRFDYESNTDRARIGVSSSSQNLQFYTAGNNERMRIDEAGTLIVNRASAISNAFSINVVAKSTGGITMMPQSNASFEAMRFVNFGLTAAIGNITCSTTSTSFNTSSDYRLKENVVDLTGASARVNQLNPSRFNFIADADTTVDGFLAHEVATVVPEAITGTKDAMKDEEYEVTPAVEATYDEDGNELTAAVEAVMGTRSVPDYQGIDQGKLVPLLTAALQEALTEIASLKTRVEALEA